MTNEERARIVAYFKERLGEDGPQVLPEMRVDYRLAHMKDERLEEFYKSLKKSWELYNNPTATRIRELLNEFGAWNIWCCMNCVGECNTGHVEDGYGATLRDLYRKNGTDANVNFEVSIIRWKESTGRLVARVKVPYNASDKVIQNRLAKLRAQVN